MKNSKLTYFIALILLAFVSSCSNLKYLPPGEQLYTGAELKIKPKQAVNKKKISTEIEDVIRPKPNKTFLGMRPQLWFYNIAGDSAKKGIRKWIKNKLGEPPVLYSQVDPELMTQRMENTLDNIGYFTNNVEYEAKTKEKKVEVVYTATVSKPYTIRRVIFPEGNDSLSTAIRRSQEETLLEEGIQYDLVLIKDERARIDQVLKNLGYYYFNPDYLIFQADTTVGENQIDMMLTIKRDVSSKALISYKLDDIYVIPQYSLTRRPNRVIDTVSEYNYHFVDIARNYRHKVLTRYIKLKRGEEYSKKNQDLTISRLMSMGVFKFVNIKFRDTIVEGEGYLDADINLTQMLPKTLKADLEISSKSNNYTGPTLEASFRNRNLFKGAELLIINLNATVETQLSGDNKGVTSWEYGAGVQLVTPRFLVPFNLKTESSLNIPKTKFDLQFRVLHRVEFFDMNGLNFTFGYIWKETESKEYQVNPIAINFAKVYNTTPVFESKLNDNPYLRRTFEEQFTFGSTASFTYNTLIGIPKRDQYYFNIAADVSGNLASLVHRTFTGEKSTDERPYELFGSRFSQYSKLTTDFRYYNSQNEDTKIATRIIIGAGIPYGNSIVMPYSKQFFSGGPNSIRAFLPRTVGPGSYITPEETESDYLDQSGDIKLELNLEYRFPLVSVLKGALFTDAGNVWLVRSNEFTPGGEFDIKRFYKEIAMGVGFGFRIDLSFFLLRLDLSIPVRKPYREEGNRWVFDEISLGNKQWRRDNLIYNIAVGYPF